MREGERGEWRRKQEMCRYIKLHHAPTQLKASAVGKEQLVTGSSLQFATSKCSQHHYFFHNIHPLAKGSTIARDIEAH